MQLRFTFFILLISCNLIFSQEKEPEYKRDKIKTDFFINYYNQDGDHSPVTGGKGTEEQTIIAPTLLLNIPTSKNTILDMNIGIDNISSASTDNIDGSVSSASKDDNRFHSNAWFTYKLKNSNQTIGVMTGLSLEYDVDSIHIGGKWTINSNDDNKSFDVTAKYFHDQWDLYYPIELRPFADTLLKDDVRRSSYLSFTYSQVLTKKLQASVSTDFIFQSGLLSTPFHRVYFDDGNVDIERLPDSRFKIASGFRFHYFINSTVSSRLFYRFYWDDFGIIANTIELEVPIKIGSLWTVIPSFRFNQQSESDYFGAFQTHAPGSEFHTSDYDLAKTNSSLLGIHIRFTPIWNNFLKFFNSDSFDLRTSYYDRDDGLTGFTISAGTSISF